jgi:hypothetical protein
MLVDDRLRSLEEAFADLPAKNQENPSPALGRMIRRLETEIAERKAFEGGEELGPLGAPQIRATPEFPTRRSCRITSSLGSATTPGAVTV